MNEVPNNPPPEGPGGENFFHLFRVWLSSWLRISNASADPANLTAQDLERHLKPGQDIIVDGDARDPVTGKVSGPRLRVQKTVIKGDDDE